MQKAESILKKVLSRNKKVDLEAQWRDSLTHRVSVTLLIYIITVVTLYFTNTKDLYTIALIPSLGYFASTIKLKVIRHIWEQYQ